MDRCDHGLWDARRGADRVLEGAEVGARLERAAGGVGVLREREQLRHWRNGWRGIIGEAGIVRLFFWGERGLKLVGVASDILGMYARSMPAENTFSLAEDRTTMRTVGSSAIQSNAAPYSRQNLAHVNDRLPLVRAHWSFTHSSLNALTGGLMGFGFDDSAVSGKDELRSHLCARK